MVAFNRRFDPNFARLEREIRAGRIGRPESLSTHRWREMGSNHRFRATTDVGSTVEEPLVCRLFAGESWIRTIGSYSNLKSSSRGMSRVIEIVQTYLGVGAAMVQPFFFCASNHSTEPSCGARMRWMICWSASVKAGSER